MQWIDNCLGWAWYSGLVVMRWDSQSEGCEFESQHHILDDIFTLICCKNYIDVCLKKTEKEARDWLKKAKKRPGMAHILEICLGVNSGVVNSATIFERIMVAISIQNLAGKILLNFLG